jgi:protein-arginine kinase activator protein McsA
MTQLRERCEAHYFKSVDIATAPDWTREKEIDALEAFAKEIRNEALEEAAKLADELYNGFHSPYEYAENVQDRIRALKESI